MWPNPQFPADLVTLTEEILNEQCKILLFRAYGINQTISHPKRFEKLKYF